MAKYIDEKLFNPKTTELVSVYIAIKTTEDNRIYSLVEFFLRKKTTGEFFVVREIAEGDDCPEERQWVQQHKVEYFSLEGAKNWVERHGDLDLYIKLFGEPER